MKRLTICLTVLALLAVCPVFAQEEAEQKKNKEAAQKKPLVQIAILLDNSGSMGGLINQARSELWKIVNEFVTAKLGDQQPNLEVAVYHYGRPPATQLVPLTDDLDRVSEALFGIPVSGGSEHCGQVIQMATDDLKWSNEGRDLKLIFIAGNEPFTQGPVNYRDACKAAIAKGIMVNTIHCGNGIPAGWKDGALLADGKSMNINHQQAVVNIQAPQDKKIAQLGVDLNKTYIPFGMAGKKGLARQAAQDANARGASLASGQQRAVAKANSFYRNARWDLCDACLEGKIDLKKIKVEDLPENMRKMTVEQRLKYVKDMQKQRETLKKQINSLNAARVKYVVDARKEAAEKTGEKTLDEALIGAIRDQAAGKNYRFGK